MNDQGRSQLQKYIDEAEQISEDWQASRWFKRVERFLEQVLGFDESMSFQSLVASNIFDELAMKQGHLEGLLAKSADNPDGPVARDQQSDGQSTGYASREVFVVHGHDGEVKESVARFLEKLGLVPVVLHEQPNQDRTIIEKFEVCSSDVAFAVVLLTPDDFGCPADDKSTLYPRARQNVILELGYFLGRLTRTRVCALHKGGVELPSDYQGVVYIEFDAAGAWKAKLAQEFVEAKLTIKVEALINK